MREHHYQQASAQEHQDDILIDIQLQEKSNKLLDDWKEKMQKAGAGDIAEEMVNEAQRQGIKPINIVTPFIFKQVKESLQEAQGLLESFAGHKQLFTQNYFNGTNREAIKNEILEYLHDTLKNFKSTGNQEQDTNKKKLYNGLINAIQKT
ncbi:hypothetical protein CCZ01_02380 [Helicobacter monodelphidis]|uniref:hypothetical protein n=1 Tax=Helicobacter sp. 15-1451 TaxID=2004995 RepID=UPI000DCD4B5F|nr:hypothetical protein [Helicobacter sp. 15-1451]RAX58648.1 hypothetical protein CCZ01_02380 [Helicobacter sp. 15-1451]